MTRSVTGWNGASCSFSSDSVPSLIGCGSGLLGDENLGGSVSPSRLRIVCLRASILICLISVSVTVFSKDSRRCAHVWHWAVSTDLETISSQTCTRLSRLPLPLPVVPANAQEAQRTARDVTVAAMIISDNLSIPHERQWRLTNKSQSRRHGLACPWSST